MHSHHSTTVTAADEQRPSMALVSLVAAVTNTDPVDLEPLYNAIDPEALDSLCTPDASFSSIEFEYVGHTVVVEPVDSGVELSLESVTIGAENTHGIADSEPSA